MSLLDEVVAAHGGVDGWRAVTALTAHGRFGGLLSARFPGNRMAELTVRVCPAEQHAVVSGFPRADLRAVFDRGDVRIETVDGELVSARRNARAAFGGITRTFRWDALDAAYFAGYACWNYLATPLLLTREGVTVDEQWRRLDVSFPPDLHTHSPRQTFHVDAAGLVRRHDYVAEPVGRWARAAQYCDEHRRFGGLVFPTRRRVLPRGPGGLALPAPVLVALDIDHIDVERAVEPAAHRRGTHISPS